MNTAIAANNPKIQFKCVLCRAPFSLGDEHLCTDPSKEITTTTHPDGRKDVRISVNRLDVEPQDEETQKAKDIIEGKVLPKLAEAPVLVVVLHKPTNAHSEKIVQLKQVRAYAEAAVRKFLGEGTLYYTRFDEFAIIEHHLENGQIKVSTL